MQMYNKQKEIEALEKRQALGKVQQEEEAAQSAAPERANGAAQQDQLHSNAAANGGLYRATSHRAAPPSTPAAPVDAAAEVALLHLKRRDPAGSCLLYILSRQSTSLGERPPFCAAYLL